MDLCGEDPTKMANAISMNVREALTFIAYKISKNKLIEQLQKNERNNIR